jgi:ribokinase
MKVLVFGSINIDLIFSVDHIVRGGETIASSSLVRSAGGKGANQAAALAKAGLAVSFAGKTGTDGMFLRELLESYGVDTTHTRNYDGATGQAVIQLDKNKQNAIVLFAGGNGAITPAEAGQTLEHFGEGDLLVLQNEITLTGSLISMAHERHIRIALNPSPYDERVESFPLEFVALFFVNEIEGAQLAHLPAGTPCEDILNALTARFPASEIILTAGKDGAYYGCGTERAHAGILDTPVVDTTGAGDTFLGFFIAAQMRGFAAAAALAAACKASSIAVSRLGAMEAIPFTNEVF